ncbi:unnamed protein product [Cuscuta epithymum]|uniref:Uncharacterized protein n=1 Tax=Cuscuta epithymum TaxID=186058 RepID=A0AAV0FH80_9ASTE|nr:unnamed protein product [Cuscuta epithymum]
MNIDHFHPPPTHLLQLISQAKTDANPLPDGTAAAGGNHPGFCTRSHWKPHEDAKLKELVALHGPHNWNFIAQHLHGRSGKSCRLRWFNQLDPKLNKTAFTEEEEEMLIEAHKMYGNKWAMISRLFPGRTDNAVKNHWHVLVARDHRRQPPPPFSSPVSGESRASTSSSGCKRRKRSNDVEDHRTRFLNAAAGNESTADDTKSSAFAAGDETASTCTDLCLPAATFSLYPTPPPDFQIIRTVKGSSSWLRVEGVKERSVGWGGQSDSSNSSQVSASESVGNSRKKTSSDQGNPMNNKVHFYDFLGLGATA